MPRKAAATAKIYQIHEIPAAWALVLAGDDDAYDDDFCTPTGVLVHIRMRPAFGTIMARV